MGKVRLVEKTRKIMQWYNSEGDNYIKYRIEPFFISNDDTYVHRIGRLLTHTGPMTPAEIVDARRALRLSGLSE